MEIEMRQRILDGSLEILRAGNTVSLDSAARLVGLTKAGLMHHFPTKEALMLALVDHVVDSYEASLTERVGTSPDRLGPFERIGAYLEWSLTGTFDESDLVMMTDPRLRERLIERWVERMSVWLTLPENISPSQRARLIAVRLIADGAWFADATDFLPLTDPDRGRVRAIANNLLKEDS